MRPRDSLNVERIGRDGARYARLTSTAGSLRSSAARSRPRRERPRSEIGRDRPEPTKVLSNAHSDRVRSWGRERIAVARRRSCASQRCCRAADSARGSATACDYSAEQRPSRTAERTGRAPRPASAGRLQIEKQPMVRQAADESKAAPRQKPQSGHKGWNGARRDGRAAPRGADGADGPSPRLGGRAFRGGRIRHRLG